MEGLDFAPGFVGGDADDDGADRLGRGSAAGAGDAASGDAQVSVIGAEQAIQHGMDGLFADRAVGVDSLLRDAEQLCFPFIGVGHQGAREPGGGARHIGEGSRDAAASAGFRSGDGQAALS